MQELYEDLPKEKYYPAHICKNGHEQRDSENIYCPDCGAIVLHQCGYCDGIIKRGTNEVEETYYNPYDPEKFTGYEHFEVPFKNFKLPSYCSECGQPYPWTKKFLDDYKLILELQDEEINEAMQTKIYNATEEALKTKFTGNPLTILGLTYRKLSPSVRTILINALTNVTSSEIIKTIINLKS